MLAEALNIVSFAPAKCSRVPDCGQNKFISSSFSSFNQESYERTKLVSPSLWVWGKDPDDEEVQEVQKEILLEAQNEAAVINDFEMVQSYNLSKIHFPCGSSFCVYFLCCLNVLISVHYDYL